LVYNASLRFNDTKTAADSADRLPAVPGTAASDAASKLSARWAGAENSLGRGKLRIVYMRLYPAGNCERPSRRAYPVYRIASNMPAHMLSSGAFHAP